MPFRDHLRAARAVAGMSQEALARRSGVSQSAISAIENGERSPSEETMQLLAAALGRCVSDMTVVSDCEEDCMKKAAQQALDGQINQLVQLASRLTPENQAKLRSYLGYLLEREQPERPAPQAGIQETDE